MLQREEIFTFALTFQKSCGIETNHQYIHVQMKKLLQFFIPVVFVAIALACYTGKSDTSVTVGQMEVSVSEKAASCLDTSTMHFDLHLPSQISLVNALRTHTTPHRTSSTQRYNFLFFRTGSAIHARTYSFIQQASFHIRYAFVKPITRLISLGKLVI